MKKLKLIPFLALAVATSLTSCGDSGTPERQKGFLNIVVYNGGYGYEWLDAIATEFTAKTGIRVRFDANSNLLSIIDQQLTDVTNYDIYMSHGINWQNYASRGLLANLDDLYDTVVNETTGKKFVDRFSNGSAELSRYTNQEGEEHYYKVNWTQGAGGLIYNADMFEDHGWKVPETYDELLTLCDTISKAGIKPFAWAGGANSRDYYWDYLIYEWWAELEGVDNFNEWLTYKNDGLYTKGYENYNPNGRGAKFKQAFGMWYDLIAKHPEYSNDKPWGANLIDAQTEFFSGRAAMIPYGQWGKREIQNNSGGTFNFDVKFMRTPRASAQSDYYNFMVGFGDSMIIPENSPNQDIAKQFIKFLQTEWACKKFVELAEGPFLSFDYSDFDMGDLTSKDPYIASMYEVISDSVNISDATNSPLVILNSSTDVSPWVNNKRYYDDAASDPNTFTVDEVMNRVYESAKSSWATFCRNAGLQNS